MLWRFRFECNVLLLIHWSCLLMSNSWYLEVTNKNFSALTLPCGLSFFSNPTQKPQLHHHALVSSFFFLALAQCNHCLWAEQILRKLFQPLSLCVLTQEALCGITVMHFSSNAWYNSYPIKPCVYGCSWACFFIYWGGFIDGFLKEYLAAAVQQKPIKWEMEGARDFFFLLS